MNTPTLMMLLAGALFYLGLLWHNQSAQDVKARQRVRDQGSQRYPRAHPSPPPLGGSLRQAEGPPFGPMNRGVTT